MLPDEVKKVFHDFLYFRNNKSWTTLYRTGTTAMQNTEGLSRLITSILDDSVDIRSRVDNALTGKMHINGVGKNIATGIIHVCDTEDRYGVWNSRTEETLQLLKRAPTHASTSGETYKRINRELSQLKTELATDLLVVDSFMWYISKRVKVIERPS